MFAFVWFQELLPTQQVPSNIGTTTAEISVRVGDSSVMSRVVTTPEDRAQGLSGTKTLSETEGMLFVFEEDARHSFWMKDMLISIDIIWLSKDKQVVHVVPNATPESYPTAYSPDDNARYVLEVPAGWAARHKVTLGSTAVF